MKKFAYVLLLILMCVLFFILYNSRTQKKDWSENIPLSEFMIGKWKGEITIDNGSMIYLAKFQLKFKNKNKLEYCSEYLDNYSCSKHTYHLVRDNIFELENDRGNQEWKISRDGDNLLICMSTNPIDKDNCNIIFTRDDSFWF